MKIKPSKACSVLASQYAVTGEKVVTLKMLMKPFSLKMMARKANAEAEKKERIERMVKLEG